jgi:hypothetical protein
VTSNETKNERDQTMKAQTIRRNATLLMTGHTLTLLIDGQPVAGCVATKRSVDALKNYIRVRKDTLTFTDDNVTLFPWLREVMA